MYLVIFAKPTKEILSLESPDLKISQMFHLGGSWPDQAREPGLLLAEGEH